VRATLAASNAVIQERESELRLLREEVQAVARMAEQTAAAVRTAAHRTAVDNEAQQRPAGTG